ncbi:MAG: cytochrome c [Gammaproteobacteria bacterium]
MMKAVFTSIVLALAAGTLLTASAHDDGDGPTPAERAAGATETRQAVFKLLGYNMGTIGAMAKGDIEFDAGIAERNARRIANLASMIPELFARMDTLEFDVETEALDVIWEKPEQFRSRAMDLVEGANEFADIAADGDRMEVIGNVRELGSNCGNCHDDFRVDDD